MLLAVGFSAVLYHISANELSRGLRRQGIYLNGIPVPAGGFGGYQQFRQAQLSEEQAHLLQNLILFNLATLVLGGAVSYFLARRTLEPIEATMEKQSRFTADASHELRTPLTAMQTEIEVALRDQGLSKAEARTLLQSNLEEVAKLRALSDGLLRLATVDDQDRPQERVKLEQVINDAFERVSKSAKTKSITIQKPEVPSELVVLGDAASLVELVVILLDNALKYSQPKTAITLTVGRHAKQAVVRVADQGAGIKATDLPHIFDRFYRADVSRSKEQVNGYGLGLSIARKIVDLHGGIIEVSSAPGQGSVFTVKLPLAPGATDTT